MYQVGLYAYKENGSMKEARMVAALPTWPGPLGAQPWTCKHGVTFPDYDTKEMECKRFHAPSPDELSMLYKLGHTSKCANGCVC